VQICRIAVERLASGRYTEVIAELGDAKLGTDWSAGKTASIRDECNGTERDSCMRLSRRIRGEEQQPDQAIRQVCTAADRILTAARRAPADASAAPVGAPVTADTRRQSAASDDRGSGAERPMAIMSHTT